MKIKITARELLDEGLWDRACELKGLDPWCISEGQMSSNEELELTEGQAQILGLIPKAKKQENKKQTHNVQYINLISIGVEKISCSDCQEEIIRHEDISDEEWKEKLEEFGREHGNNTIMVSV